MEQGLQLKAVQQLSLTPQLQQAIGLLQLSAAQLQTEIQQQLYSNPLLEEIDELDDLVDAAETEVTTPSSSIDDNPLEQINAQPMGLKEHLLWQLNLSHLSVAENVMGYSLIDAIDDRGYLCSSLDDVVVACRALLHSLGHHQVLTPSMAKLVLRTIQQFEPVGVGARNLAECLRLQLAAMPETTPKRRETLELLDQMQAHDDPYSLLKAAQDRPQVIQLLRRLAPTPGLTFEPEDRHYVLPDIIAKQHRGHWQVELNPQLNRHLVINQTYVTSLANSRNKADGRYLKQYLPQAQGFLKGLQTRHDTMLKVGRLLLDLQRDFFNQGELAMRPLVMATVAEQLGIHESTVSRITANKYLATPRGTFELKYFFSSHVATESGVDCSSTAVRALITQLIDAEIKQHPLSDSQLTKRLNEHGVKVARRTVAKYREALRILPSSERKQL